MQKDRNSGTLLLFLLFLAAPVLANMPLSMADDGKVLMTGTVFDAETHLPVSNATISVWENRSFVAEGNANQTGSFAIQLTSNRNYKLCFYSSSISSKWIYIPSVIEVNATGALNVTAELKPGASIVVDNDIQFVDTTSPSSIFSFELIDPKTEKVLDIEGYRFLYGTGEDAQTRVLRTNSSMLVVPIGFAFNIRVNASAITAGKTSYRSFVIDDLNAENISRGDSVHVDIRKYTLKYNFGIVDERIDAIKSEMNTMDKLGFYLIVEKQGISSILATEDMARYQFLGGLYVDSYKVLRKTFVDASDLYTNLTDMYTSAATSVHMLVFFLAFTATAICFLLFDKTLLKVLSSAILTASMHIALHEIYPGATYVPSLVYLESSTAAWFSSVIVTVFLPHFLKGRAVDGRTPLRNILVPIFSLAKRSLMRRRLRFVLTLSSVTILVMSFVALTSFNLGYGLVLSRLSNRYIPVDAVLIRAPIKETPAREQTFTPLESGAMDWLQKQSEVKTVAPRAETQPMLLPATSLNGRSIRGVIGVLPSAEAQIVRFNEIVIEGRYLSDGEENTVLLSHELKRTLGIELDKTLNLGRLKVRVIGFFDYGKLRSLNELDGTSLIPNKLVNLAPPGEPPAISAFPVEEDELVICGIETAFNTAGVALSRVDALLREGESPNDFAERAALERNYSAWASSALGLYAASLGTYFQGKGIPLVIPWAIVVLTVVITMLNALYERRREIGILSAVGLNPADIGGIFVAEAIAIGLIGGGAGYLLGLGMYKGMTFFQITLEVKQKVSAFWSLGALGIAMTAVVIGAMTALRGSVIITPSLMRRWQIQGKEELGKPLELSLPIEVPKSEIDDFMEYILRNLRAYEGDPVTRTERIRVWTQEDNEKSIRGIRFIYRTVGPAFSSYSLNELTAERKAEEETYKLKMLANGDKKWVHDTGTMIRLIIMRWSTRRQA